MATTTKTGTECQKPFNLEGVDFNVDSFDVINLRSVKVSFYSKI